MVPPTGAHVAQVVALSALDEAVLGDAQRGVALVLDDLAVSDRPPVVQLERDDMGPAEPPVVVVEHAVAPALDRPAGPHGAAARTGGAVDVRLEPLAPRQLLRSPFHDTDHSGFGAA